MDYRILEPSRLVVTARGDVRAALRQEAGESFYFLEDRVRNRHFRLGLVEYGIFQELDGQRPLADVVVSAARHDGSQALTIDEAVALVKWLVEVGLAFTDAALTPARLDGAGKQPTGFVQALANPWFVKLTCDAPRRLLQRLEPVGRMLFSREFLVLWVVCLVAGLGTAVSEWPQIVAARPIEFGWAGIVRMLVAWCLLKVLHEAGHALACERFGGRVGGCGVAFILGMPSPFVEVSSAWRMPNKWRRMIVSLAGIYVELFVASTAVLIWSVSTGDVVRHCALATATVASIGTLLFNLNPLMRFDGYFALSDWLEVPNLSTRARHEWHTVVRRQLAGVDEPLSDAPRNGPRWLPWFGAATAAWKVVVAVSLIWLSLSRFGAITTAALCLLPAWFVAKRIRSRFATRARRSQPCRTINLRRLARNYALLGIGGAAALLLFDPRRVEMPAVVEYEPLCVVRAETGGFVSEVRVADGAQVAEGQVLFKMRNPELEVAIHGTEDELRQSLVRSRMLRETDEIAKEQAEAVRRGALETKLRELQARRDALTVRAPLAGRVVSRGVDSLLGRWVEPGRQLLLIGDENKKEILVAVRQYDAELLRRRVGSGAVATLGASDASFDVQLTRLEPEASCTLIHPALSAENGGELPVRRVDSQVAASLGNQTYVVELHEPYFRLHCDIDAESAASIAAGRTARLRIDATWGQLAARWWSATERALIERTK